MKFLFLENNTIFFYTSFQKPLRYHTFAIYYFLLSKSKSFLFPLVIRISLIHLRPYRVTNAQIETHARSLQKCLVPSAFPYCSVSSAKLWIQPCQASMIFNIYPISHPTGLDTRSFYRGGNGATHESRLMSGSHKKYLIPSTLPIFGSSQAPSNELSSELFEGWR